MKKTRLPALLLALLMMFVLLAGCSKDAGRSSRNTKDDEDEAEFVELERGAYEVYDEDEELVAFLDVSRREIVVYLPDGPDDFDRDDEYEYEFDEDEGVYLVDDEEAFTMMEDDGDLYLITWEDEDEYLLEEIDEDELPDQADESAAGDASTGADTQAQPETPPAASEEPEPVELDPWGTYAVYQDGELGGYLDMWDGELRLYEVGNPEYESFGYSFEDGYYRLDNGETLAFCEEDGELRLYNTEEEDFYLVLAEASYEDLPVEPVVEEMMPTLVEYGGVALLGEVPDTWREAACTETYSDGAAYVVDLYDDGCTTVQINIGDLSALGVSDFDGVKEFLTAMYVDTFCTDGEMLFNYDWEILGETWYILENGAMEDGSTAVCACIVADDVAILFLSAHEGTESSVYTYYEEVWAVINSLALAC